MNNNREMNFGEALELLKQGLYVARKNWNGKDMYLWLLPEINLDKSWVKDPKLLKEFGDKNNLFCNGSIRLKCADGSITTGWVPSQTDMLSEDWIEVKHENKSINITIKKEDND